MIAFIYSLPYRCDAQNRPLSLSLWFLLACSQSLCNTLDCSPATFIQGMQHLIDRAGAQTKGEMFDLFLTSSSNLWSHLLSLLVLVVKTDQFVLCDMANPAWLNVLGQLENDLLITYEDLVNTFELDWIQSNVSFPTSSSQVFLPLWCADSPGG